MPHGYIQLNNNLGADLPMRWIKHVDPNWPVQWDAGFTDPDSAYVNVLIEDSADFVLPFPDDFNDKLILNIDHNFLIDTSYIRFKVFPIDHPEDSLWLNYCVIIHAPDLSVKEISADLNILIDQSNQKILFSEGIFSAQLKIYNLSGKLLFSETDFSGNELKISYLNTGYYLIRIQSDEITFTQKFFLN